MTVDELEIEGFKPLKSLKFDEDDLGMVNVITGRNNTGKSSILEAIDLLYNPGHLEGFSSHAADLMNKDMNECFISNSGRNLIIKSADEENLTEYYAQAILKLFSNVSLHRDYESGGFETISEIDLEEDMKEREVITDSIRQATDEDILYLMGEDLLIVEVDNEPYPYFHFSGGLFDKISDIIISTLTEAFAEELEGIPESELSIGIPYPQLRQNPFFLDEPTNTEQAKLIKTPITDINDYEPESEQDAVKIDDIEDYITERGLVDNLKDFDLDYLVFEEDGEKDSVPFDFMGDGFKSMVGILWELVEDDESEIVMIEEPENHMHPGYVQEMFDFLVTMAREDDIQLFITTHSIDFINYMFDEDLPEEHREFLEDELSVIRMESPELAAVFDYEEAKKNSEELHLDLRGI